MRYKLVDEDFEGILIELGVIFISKVCRITAKQFMGFLYSETELHEYTINQLNFLAEIVKCLEGGYRKHDGSIKRWFHRRRPEALGNFSPYQIMMWPSNWKPEDKMMKKVLEIARGVNSDAT